jgi:hypothetical protein
LCRQSHFVRSHLWLLVEPWNAELHASSPSVSHPKASHTAPDASTHASAPYARRASEAGALPLESTPAPATRS